MLADAKGRPVAEVVKLERFSPYTIAEIEFFDDDLPSRWREILVYDYDPLQVRALISAATDINDLALSDWSSRLRARFPATELGWRMARKAACV